MQEVLVYSDEGVDAFGLSETLSSLKASLDPSRYRIQTIDATQVKKGLWCKSCTLFVMPGGRDLPYLERLGPSGMALIKSYVEEGGSYLGLCAGAYFASGLIEFEKGGPLEVVGERFLKFISGKAIGPALDKGSFRYEAPLGAKAALISWKDHSLSTYYNGGCYFFLSGEDKGVEVLSRYLSLEDAPASIIGCSVGKGRAVLSGVHFEFSSKALSARSGPMQKILAVIEKYESKRVQLCTDVLTYLGLGRSE